MRDLTSKLDHELTRAAAVATGNGTNIDFTGVDSSDALSVTHIVNVGVSADTLSGTLYHTFKLQESDDNSTYTDASADDVIVRNGNTVLTVNAVVIDAAAEDPVAISFGYIGHKQYSRVRDALTGNHATGTPLAGSCIKESKVVQPAI